ncbi:nuclear factor 7, brain-like isoform X1 [Mizuhopecten yessoensis]|uniref:nuclear factor 7, brain-like isoform X1 n=1 Tax=Mizuhopecten yessoensis TaxID=6573 RepID=UPI000B45DAB7|nr:nuclear factor 7, brain-like isoform X1 [Mizuhopecten yessoensis]
MFHIPDHQEYSMKFIYGGKIIERDSPCDPMEMPSSDLRDIISCPICYEDFEEPKALPCLHTFCKECLQQLIVKSMEPDVKKYFHCPSCRRKVYGPKDVAFDKWANTYPSNHTIRTLQDNFKIENTDSICSLHKGKEMEFFCTDHERTICSLCMVKEHRQCKEVDTIEAAADKTREKISEIDENLHMLDNWVDKKRKRQHLVQSHLSGIETSVRTWRKEINDELDRWESNVTEQVQTAAATGISQLDQDIRHGEHIMYNLKNAKTELVGVDQSARRILDERASIASVLRDAKGVINSADSNKTYFLFKFQGNESLKKSLTTIGEIKVITRANETLSAKDNFTGDMSGKGNLCLRSGGCAITTTADIGVSRTSLNPNAKQFMPRGKFNARTSRDKDDCLITGGTFLPDGNLAITDQSNGKIKFFDHHFNLLSEMGFSSAPWDVCSTGSDIIAVSFPDDNLVQFFKVKDGQIRGTEGNIKTPGRCYGIDIRGKLLAFTCRSRHDSSVHVIHRTEGQILGTWFKDKNAVSTAGGMWYLAFDDNGDILYVTDDDENRVFTLAVDSSLGTSLKLINTQECDNHNPRGVTACGPNIVVTSPAYDFDLRVYPQGPGTKVIKARGAVVSVDRKTNRMFISPPSTVPHSKSNICHVRPFTC